MSSFHTSLATVVYLHNGSLLISGPFAPIFLALPFLVAGYFLHGDHQLPQSQPTSPHQFIVVLHLALRCVWDHFQTQSLTLELKDAGMLLCGCRHDRCPFLFRKRFAAALFPAGAHFVTRFFASHLWLAGQQGVLQDCPVCPVTAEETVRLDCDAILAKTKITCPHFIKNQRLFAWGWVLGR